MSAPERSPMGRPNLEVFAEEVERVAREDERLLVVTSDSRGSGKLAGFAQRHPSRIVDVGIAEQNLVAVAAGLAAGGRNVFAVSPASFLTARAFEQIKHDVCYSDHPVTLVGISAGVSYGALGTTHHSLHDLAALRAVHNLIVVAPADNWEAAQAVRSAAASEVPVYLRFGKKPLPDLPNPTGFHFGGGRVVRDGADGVIVATGEAVWRSLEAARALESEGYAVGVVSMHTVKPLDLELLCSLGASARAVLTVEEHSVHGGLGEACAHALLEAGLCPRFRCLGVPDEYTVTGSQEQILDHYGLSPSGIAKTMRTALEGAG